MKTITITSEELGHPSGYTDIAEDIGYCVGVGGIQDEYWYFEAIDEAENYTRENYNLESDLFEMEEEKFIELYAEIFPEAKQGYIDFVDKHLKTSAKIALDAPKLWESILKDIREQLKNSIENNLMRFFPELEQEIIDASCDEGDRMRKEFINGDYHGNFEGIERKLAKQLEADDVEVGLESVSITWNDEESLKERLYDYFGRKDLRMTKRWAIEEMKMEADGFINRRRAENVKRKEERIKTAEYQEKRKAEEEAERKAKLQKILK